MSSGLSECSIQKYNVIIGLSGQLISIIDRDTTINNFIESLTSLGYINFSLLINERNFEIFDLLLWLDESISCIGNLAHDLSIILKKDNDTVNMKIFIFDSLFKGPLLRTPAQSLNMLKDNHYVYFDLIVSNILRDYNEFQLVNFSLLNSFLNTAIAFKWEYCLKQYCDNYLEYNGIKEYTYIDDPHFDGQNMREKFVSLTRIIIDNKDLLKQIIKYYPQFYYLFIYSEDHNHSYDEELAILYLQFYGRFACIKEKFFDSESVILAAIEYGFDNPMKYVSSKQKDNKIVVLHAMKKWPLTYYHISDRLKDDSELFEIFNKQKN